MAGVVRDQYSAGRKAITLRESETIYVTLLSNALEPGGATTSNFTNALPSRLQFPDGYRVQIALVALSCTLVPGGEHHFLVYTDVTEWAQRVGNDTTTVIRMVTLQDGENGWQAEGPLQWVNATGANNAVAITVQIRDFNDNITGDLTGKTGVTLAFRVMPPL